MDKVGTKNIVFAAILSVIAIILGKTMGCYFEK